MGYDCRDPRMVHRGFGVKAPSDLVPTIMALLHLLLDAALTMTLPTRQIESLQKTAGPPYVQAHAGFHTPLPIVRLVDCLPLRPFDVKPPPVATQSLT